MIPFSPSAPFLGSGPKFCAAADLLQRGEPGLVPSTTTVFRFIPRTWMRGVVIRTPAGVSAAPLGALLELVL